MRTIALLALGILTPPRLEVPRAALLVLLALASSSVAFAHVRLVAEHQRDGIRNTRPFAVDAAANPSLPAPGASHQPRGGRYYLQVDALGRCTIRVVPLP